MVARAFVGATHSDGEEVNNTPLKGVDGVLGVVMLLAYYAGGVNIFPHNINVEQYIEKRQDSLLITDKQLSSLLQDCSVAIKKHIKALSYGSMKVYLSWLRNGERPYVSGGMLAVESKYDKHGNITIHPRFLKEDIESGVFIIPQIPDWIELLARQNGYNSNNRAVDND